MKPSKHPNVDGRLLRGEKTRKRIIAAFQGFAAKGILEPKGAELARRAKVSVRAIYQHFPTAAVQRQEAHTEEQWRAEASRLRALSDRELVEATLAGRLGRKAQR
jgi:AcrR family transcriptional regulator